MSITLVAFAFTLCTTPFAQAGGIQAGAVQALEPGHSGLGAAIRSDTHMRAMHVDQGGKLRRGTGSAALGALDTIYDNTCATGYYVSVGLTPMAVGDWGGVPGPSYPGDANCSPGCASSYDIQNFEFAYCTTSGAPVDLVLHFWDRTATGGSGLNACSGVALIGGVLPPAVTTVADVTMTGLPRSSALGSPPACYVINVAASFTLSAGTSFTPLSTMGDRFAWAMQVDSAPGTGPLVAGNAFLSTCRPCAGTIWQAGGMTPAPGNGLGQDRNMWLDTFGAGGTGDCYFTPGNALGLHLVLESTPACGPVTYVDFCSGTDDSLIACPCGNDGHHHTGCDNAQGTGGVRIDVVAQTTSPNGATLTGTGYPVMSSPAALVMRANALDPAAPVVFGDGLRCVGTPLVRIGATTASGGTSTHVIGHGAGPGAGVFYYQIWYRNTRQSFCDPLEAFNLSNGTTITW